MLIIIAIMSTFYCKLICCLSKILLFGKSILILCKKQVYFYCLPWNLFCLFCVAGREMDLICPVFVKDINPNLRGPLCFVSVLQL